MESTMPLWATVLVQVTLAFFIFAVGYKQGKNAAEDARREKLAKRLYICEHNGVIGVVRAEDFEKVIERWWDYSRARGFANPPQGQCCMDFEMAVFSKVKTDDSRSMGTMAHFNLLIDGCQMEKRDFFVPGPFQGHYANFREIFVKVHGHDVPQLIMED